MSGARKVIPRRVQKGRLPFTTDKRDKQRRQAGAEAKWKSFAARILEVIVLAVAATSGELHNLRL
jgi:hypothetical protein